MKKLATLLIDAGFPVALAAALWLGTSLAGHAQLVSVQPMGADVYVQVETQATGEASIGAWSGKDSDDLVSVLPEVLHCQGAIKPDSTRSNKISCSKALQRNGLSLEGVVDLAPIVQRLDSKAGVQLWINDPHLGFETISAPLEEQSGSMRVIHTAHFDPGIAPPSIHIEFGYRPDQLAGVYLPLVALALAITFLAATFARIGAAGLSRSILLLGTILWMAAAAQLQVASLVHILLFANPLANLAALGVDFWPPLLCVAAGIAFGSWNQDNWKPLSLFNEVFWAFAVIPLILTSVIGALPAMMERNWIVAIPWLATAPAFALLRRSWIRARARTTVRQLSEGELRERISALLAKARRPPIKIYISSSTRTQASAAFTLPGKSIYMTAPLVGSLSKREVDAVAAHELAHTSHSNRGQWTALVLAMILFVTPVDIALLSLPGGLLATILLLVTVLIVSLSSSRKREFGADAYAAALTGDPRAMISSLARISRNNKSPLDMNRAVEWLSTHPSTRKRIRALAAAYRLDPAEVESLCSIDDPGPSYELPSGEGVTTIFTPAWQAMNVGVYSWIALLGSSIAGVVIAWLFFKTTGPGALQLLLGIVLGCLLTKGVASAVMARNFAAMQRKLEARLGVNGRLVGLAIDSQPLLYGGRRFSDAGILSFADGMLCYRSERTSIELNPANVIDLTRVAASPSNWFRLMPVVRFRRPESEIIEGFILHSVDWFPTQRHLFDSVQRWRATQPSTQATSITGFNHIDGQPFAKVSVRALISGLGISLGAALIAAIPLVLALNIGWWFLWYVLAIAACAQSFMFLPAMLYRLPSVAAQSMPQP